MKLKTRIIVGFIAVILLPLLLFQQVFTVSAGLR